MHVQTHVRMQRASRGDTCLTARCHCQPAIPLPPSCTAPRGGGGLRRVGPGPPGVWVPPHRAPGRRRATMAGMSFFDDVPSVEPEPPPVRHPWDPPEAEFPGVVAFSTLILGRAERAAVAITGLSAYSAGFEIFVTARLRPDAGGDAGPGDRMPGGPEPGGARRSFRLGLQLADGGGGKDCLVQSIARGGRPRCRLIPDHPDEHGPAQHRPGQPPRPGRARQRPAGPPHRMRRMAARRPVRRRPGRAGSPAAAA